VNIDELEHVVYEAEQQVLKIQTKLHRWARDDPRRRFDDLFNLVADSGFLLVAWDRVRGNKGARTAGVDGQTAASIHNDHPCFWMESLGRITAKGQCHNKVGSSWRHLPPPRSKE
jgi:hypothetical protein